MRCLVTGASGHIGSYLTRHLLAQDHTVAALVRPQSDLWRIADVVLQLTLIRGDLAGIAVVAPDVQAFAPEIVFHLAWGGIAKTQRDDYDQQIEGNLLGSLNLLKVAQEAGCQRWVGLGSQAEYGPSDRLLHEDLPPRPVTLYGASKLSAGVLSAQLCAQAGTRFLWVRLLATYGPMDEAQRFLPTVIEKLLAGEKPALTGGAQRWDYLYVQDAVEALYELALSPRAEGVVNLGSGDARPVREIVERIRDLIDPELPLGFGEISYPRDRSQGLEADLRRLWAVTDWRPRVALEDGLQATIAWHRAGVGLTAVGDRS